MDIGLIAFGCLGLAIVSLWLFESPIIWYGLLAVAAALAWWSGLLNVYAVGFSLVAGNVIYAYYREPMEESTKAICGVGLALFTLGLFGNFFHGFPEKTLMSNVVLSPGAYPTSIIWSFDKPLAGLLLTGWGITRLRGAQEWAKILPVVFTLYLGCALFMLSVALPLGVLRWAPKWNETVALFAFGNLLFACVAEEAFFRGFIQRKLGEVFAPQRHGQMISLGIASLIFGLCHFAGGIGLMLAATAAGLFYGAAYQRTGRVEAAILVHFLLNFTHFALFSYPALRIAH